MDKFLKIQLDRYNLMPLLQDYIIRDRIWNNIVNHGISPLDDGFLVMEDLLTRKTILDVKNVVLAFKKKPKEFEIEVINWWMKSNHQDETEEDQIRFEYAKLREEHEALKDEHEKLKEDHEELKDVHAKLKQVPINKEQLKESMFPFSFWHGQ